MLRHTRLNRGPEALLWAPLPFAAARSGPPPRTSGVLPHIQLDQWPPPAIVARLIDRSLQFPHVRARQSRMASPETQALWVSDERALGPAEAFIDGLEFCHLHAAPEGSLHLTLPREVRPQVLKLGWAELHLLVRAGFLPESLVLVYAPRNDSELEIALRLVQISCQFAQGVYDRLRSPRREAIHG
ncbi:MAG: DUF5519 family protein [Acidobacteriia bacterium]|nr:DUF5519 family protein [Terriglobia bacterium]